MYNLSKVKIIDNKIYCGECGHQIGYVKEGQIYITCKHRYKHEGKNKYCNTENEVK